MNMTAAEFDRELDETLARAVEAFRFADEIRRSLVALNGHPERLWRSY
jgi:hypothetical protein